VNALTCTSELAFKFGDTGEISGLFGVVERVKSYWVISGSCWAGNGYPDRVSATVSVSHLVGGLELVPTAVGSDEGPATGANSISGRASCSSGHDTTLGLSRVQLLLIDRRVTESAEPYQSVWTDKTTSGRSISASGRSKMAPGADRSWAASGSWKTRGIHARNADFMVSLKISLFCAMLVLFCTFMRTFLRLVNTRILRYRLRALVFQFYATYYFY